MGVVYEGEQAAPHRRVAIKTAHSWLRSPGVAERFAFEMQALASLRHRSIPRLYEVREVGGTTWMVMELVRGTPLDRHVATLSRAERLALLLEVMEGVSHAHEAGIVHRDLKPQNILVADGQPRILDFGLALSLDAGALEGSDGVVGTLAYMAPEQLDVQAVCDQRVDVYALGVLVYHLLKGNLPVAFPLGSGATTVAAVRRAKLSAPAPRGLGEDLDAIVGKAMATAPGDRYPSVAALADDVRRALRSEPVHARPATLGYRLRKWHGRHRVLVRGVALTLVSIAAVLGLVLLWDAVGAERARAEHEASATLRLAQLEARMHTLDAADEGPRADALFTFFAGMSENLGTHALHEAWMHAGERQHARGQSDEERDAYGNAYATAVDVDERAEALGRLAVTFVNAGSYSRVDRVLARLDALGVADDTSTRRLRYDASVTRRDLGAAQALGVGQPTAPLLTALAGAQPLGLVAAVGFPLPPTSGPARLAIVTQGERTISVFGRAPEGLRRLSTTRVPDDMVFNRHFPRGLGGARVWLAAAASGGRTGLWELLGVDSPKPSIVARAAFAHDGLNEAKLVSDTPPMVVFGAAGSARTVDVWRDGQLWTAPQDVVGGASDTNAIVVGDFDGDGRTEVVMGFGPWQTYELRVLRPEADGTLSLLARRRFGTSVQLAALPQANGPPLIAVTKSDRYPNATLFGPDAPFGERAGVHVLRWTGQALASVAFTPYPEPLAPDVSPYLLLAGDLDGDGLTDLVFGALDRQQEVCVLYRQVAPLVFEPALLAGLAPLTLANLDDDAADELVVRLTDDGQRGWVLGMAGATQALPVLPDSPPPPPMQPPAMADATLADAWRRAEDLRAIGLDGRAADGLTQAARLATMPVVAAAFFVHAGEIERARDQPVLAASAYEAALAQLPTRVARRGAAESQLAAHELAAASAHYRVLAQGDDELAVMARAALAWLEPLVQSARARVVIDLRPLPASWHVHAPGSFARALGGPGVLIDTTSQEGDLAVLPVRYDGGQLVLEAALVLEHLEIGGGLTIALRRAGESQPLVLLEVWGSGGGDAITRFAGCGPWDAQLAPLDAVERPITAPVDPLTLRVDLLPSPGAASSRCDVTRVGAAQPLVQRHYPVTPLGPGDYEVVVRARGERAWTAASRIRLRLERLTIDGLTPRVVAPSALDAAHRLAFDGDAAAARQAYEALPEARVAALRMDLWLGDSGAAAADVAAIGEGWLGDLPEAQQLIRTDAVRLAPLLAKADPDRFARAFERAWSVALRYLDDPDTQALLRTPTVLALAGHSPAELALVRAAVRLALRSGEAARALGLAERALTTQAAQPSADAADALVELELLAAAAADTLGQEQRARQHLDRWRALVPSSDLATETLQYQPDVGALSRYLAAENRK